MKKAPLYRVVTNVKQGEEKVTVEYAEVYGIPQTTGPKLSEEEFVQIDESIKNKLRSLIWK